MLTEDTALIQRALVDKLIFNSKISLKHMLATILEYFQTLQTLLCTKRSRHVT